MRASSVGPTGRAARRNSARLRAVSRDRAAGVGQHADASPHRGTVLHDVVLANVRRAAVGTTSVASMRSSVSCRAVGASSPCIFAVGAANETPSTALNVALLPNALRVSTRITAGASASATTRPLRSRKVSSTRPATCRNRAIDEAATRRGRTRRRDDCRSPCRRLRARQSLATPPTCGVSPEPTGDEQRRMRDTGVVASRAAARAPDSHTRGLGASPATRVARAVSSWSTPRGCPRRSSSE